MTDNKETSDTEDTQTNADGGAAESASESGQSASGDANGAEKKEEYSSDYGPVFKDVPDPIAGVKKVGSDVLDSMEGKTVSMKTYVGSIIAVIVLMMLARCGGG